MWRKVCVLTVAFQAVLTLGVVVGQEAFKNTPGTPVEVTLPPHLSSQNLVPNDTVRGALPLVLKPALNANVTPVLPDWEPVVCACTASSYKTGDRVVAVVDNPQGASGILAGHMGTVICGGYDSPDWVLISWDGWSSGHNGNGYCGCPAVALPDTSGWWVACTDVLPANGQPVDCACSSQFFVGSRVTAAVNNPTGAPGISVGHAGTAVCGYSPAAGIPLLVAWDNWDQGHNSSGFCECPDTTLADTSAWWVYCTDVNLSSEVNCQCGGYFAAGQRVTALVDNPSGAAGILAGHQGTVVCGITPGAFPYLLVSWDSWSSGHDGNGFCSCPVTAAPDNSGWYVYCSEVGGCRDDWWETQGQGGSDDTCYGPSIAVPVMQDRLHCDEDWVWWSAVAGVTYTIQTLNLIGGADTLIELYSSCTTFIASDDDGGGGLSSRLVVTATTSGPWDLKIREWGHSYNAGEGYTLAVVTGNRWVIFLDGFESGFTSAWSTTVP